MQVTLTALHDDHGSVVRFEGILYESDETVLVAVDHRTAQAIIDAWVDDEDAEIEIEAEGWQVSRLALS